MLFKEFLDLINETGEKFSKIPGYKHILNFENHDIFMRGIGHLFNAHINQNTHCPNVSDFLNEVYTDTEEFFYDYVNHFKDTCEFNLVEAFINLSILSFKNDLKWECSELYNEKEVPLNFSNEDLEDEEYEFSELILLCISHIPRKDYDGYYKLEYTNSLYILDMLKDIYQLILYLGGDIKLFLEYKYKIEKDYE